MPTTVNAYRSNEPGGRLEPYRFELGDLAHGEVDIDVDSCGICYSDVSMIDNDWGFTPYPITPGHEIIGRIRAIGSGVTNVAVGDVVGLGWNAAYCGTCRQCVAGDQNLCPDAESTFIGRPGGYADIVRASAAAVLPIPDGVDPSTAGPLMCGGVTVFSPFLQYGVSPTDRVGVIGLGGLGHMAVKLAKAWGCEVTAFTSTGSKADAAREMGAHRVFDSHDADAIAAAADSLDLLVSTVNVPLDWNAYLGTLKRQGRLHVLGAVPAPLDIVNTELMMANRSVSSSPSGSPTTALAMLDFAARHDIAPVCETFSFEQVNEAIDHLRSGNARFRVVLQR
ncbi:MAG: NAD(P)-dependent alcohol dehydrogenase [Acidimicrobiales bacterium]|nr:NAD(P)-dependent alcohol dehydrogenase [Actinomycetota bacterium]